MKFLISILFVLATASYSAESSEVLPKDSSRLFYAYLGIGDNISKTDSDNLKNIDSSPGEWEIGIGRYVTENISVDGIFEYWGQRYERTDGISLPNTYNNNIQVTNMGLSIATVYHYKRNPFHTHIGLGAGYFNSSVLVTDPGSGKYTEAGAPSSKWLVGYHASIGFDYCVGEEFWIGLELKYRMLNADFGAYTHGEADVGGTYLYFVIKGP